MVACLALLGDAGRGGGGGTQRGWVLAKVSPPQLNKNLKRLHLHLLLFRMNAVSKPAGSAHRQPNAQMWQDSSLRCVKFAGQSFSLSRGVKSIRWGGSETPRLLALTSLWLKRAPLCHLYRCRRTTGRLHQVGSAAAESQRVGQSGSKCAGAVVVIPLGGGFLAFVRALLQTPPRPLLVCRRCAGVGVFVPLHA